MSKVIKVILISTLFLVVSIVALVLYFVNSDYQKVRQSYINYLQEEALLTVYTRDEMSKIDAQQLMNLHFSFADGWGMDTDKSEFSLIINGSTAERLAPDHVWINIYVRDIETVLTLDPDEVNQEIISELKANGLTFDGVNDVMLYAFLEHMPSSRLDYFSDSLSYKLAILTRVYNF
jgi:hypothetical protein